MAARYWVGGTANWDGTAGTKWATTSGGAGGAAVPTSADDVFFDAASGTNTITITSAATCKSIDGNTATATLAGSSTLAVSGGINIGGLTITYTGTATISVTSNLTSNGKIWTGNLTFTGTSQTYTLIDNWTVNGAVTFAGATVTLNGSTLICKGNLTSTTPGATGYVTGTTLISMQGTSTIVGSNGGYAINIDINTTGTVTFTGILYWKSGTLSYTAGTLNAGTSTINHITTGAFVLSLGTQTAYNVKLIISSAIGSTLNCSGLLSIYGTTLNTYAVNCSGSLLITGTTGAGSSLITMNGTGTLSSNTSSVALRNSLTINTAGTITIGTNLVYNTGTLTYVAGTVTTTGSLLNIQNSTTLNTNGIIWNNVTVGTATITLLSDLYIGGNYLGSGGASTFNGAFTVYLAGDFTQPYNCNIAGTASWVWNGTSNKTFSCVNSLNLSNFTINGTGVVTFINNFPIGAITFQILSPCIATDCNLIIGVTGATTTLDVSLVTWKTVNINTAGLGVANLNSPLYTYVGTFGSASQQLTINGSPIYIVNGILQSNPGNGGAILGTSQIIGIGDKFTYNDSATSVFQGQGNWRIPITVNSGYFLMIGRFVLETGGGLVINSNKVENRANFRNLPELVLNLGTYTLTNIHKCKFKNISISYSNVLNMNEFFSGSPEFKSNIRIFGGTTNFTVNFTDTKPKKAFHVNVRNCTVTNRNQLTVINRDGNAGFNSGIIFGESGLGGFPLNQYPTEVSYPMEYGFKSSFN